MSEESPSQPRQRRVYPKLWGYSVTRISYRLGQLGWNTTEAHAALQAILGWPRRSGSATCWPCRWENCRPDWSSGAIEAAKLEWTRRGQASTGPAGGAGDRRPQDGWAADGGQERNGAPPPPLEIARQQAPADDDKQGPVVAAQPYAVASFRVTSGSSLQQLSRSELGLLVKRVIEREGPVHREEVARRLAQLAGQRLVQAVQTAVDGALRHVAANGSGVVCEGPFYYLSQQADVPLRDRGQLESSHPLRKPEMLPPAEIRKALQAIVEVHLGVEREEAVREASRLFGFKRINGRLREVLQEQLEELLRSGRLDERQGKLYAAR